MQTTSSEPVSAEPRPAAWIVFVPLMGGPIAGWLLVAAMCLLIGSSLHARLRARAALR
jgi:hypothetical protein